MIHRFCNGVLPESPADTGGRNPKIFKATWLTEGKMAFACGDRFVYFTPAQR
jgi:hypothetical protein